MSSAVGCLCIHVREKGRVRDIRIIVQNVRERGREWKEIKDEKSDRHSMGIKYRKTRRRSKAKSQRERKQLVEKEMQMRLEVGEIKQGGKKSKESERGNRQREWRRRKRQLMLQWR